MAHGVTADGRAKARVRAPGLDGQSRPLRDPRRSTYRAQEGNMPKLDITIVYFPSSPQSVRRKKIAPDSRLLNPNNIVLFACCGLTGFLSWITQCNRSDATQGFRQLPLPQESLTAFTVENLTFPMYPYGSQPKSNGRRASYFQGRSFHPLQRCLRSHLPEPKSRQARHNKGLYCSPSLLRLTWRFPAGIWGL